MVPINTPLQDRCPGVLRLHEAADGGLARVRLPGGRIDARGLTAIATAAALGNGIIELTSRGSLQIRGLSQAASETCAQLLFDGGLLPSSSHERVRNIIASPLGGRHPASLAATDDLVIELDRRLCADRDLAGLSGRFLFSVDDGAGLISHRADVELRATGADSFTVGGREVPRRGAVTAAIEAAHAALTGIVSGRTGPGPCAPVRPLLLGAVTQADGQVAVTAMPRLARLDPCTTHELAAMVKAFGGDLRLSTSRTLSLVDVRSCDLADLLSRLQAADLIVDPGSGWVGLSSCAGLGACANATFDVRAAATTRASIRTAISMPEHWVGCGRNCGLPAEATLMNGLDIGSVR